jgi:hypothetical protein
MQHGSVTDARPRRRIGGVKDRPHFLDCEVRHQRLIVAFRRDGAYLPHLFQSRRRPELDKSHE